MTKEKYEEQKAEINRQISEKNKELSSIRMEYILANAPANKGDVVEIILGGVGRKVKGEVKDFAIFQDGNVYVSAYKDSVDGKMKYISKPHGKLTIC